MPVETLTQNQKNYILMLLMGGELPENEIRMFLARSGWPIDAIDAGVLYSKDADLKRTLDEARGIKVESTSIAAKVISDEYTSVPKSPDSKSADPYRETAEIVAQDFSANLATAGAAMSTPSTLLDGIKQAQKGSLQSEVPSPLIMTMPPVPKASNGKGILTAIAWFLLVLLILGISAVLGYMYYTGTGIFGDVIYTRLNLDA